MPEPFITRRRLLQSAGGLFAAAAFRPTLGADVADAAAVSDVMTTLSTYMGEARGTRAAGRRGREDQAHDSRHAGRDDFRLRAAARQVRDPVRAQPTAATSLRRSPASHRRLRPDRSGAGQRHARALRRDRRLASAVAVASGLRGRARGAGGRREVRHRRRRASCAPSRSATTSARAFTATLGKLQYMADTPPQHARHRGHLRLGRGGGRCAAGLNAQQMRWLLSYTAQQASGIASWQRDTDHIEKAFVFGGMPARNGVTAALLVEAGGTGVDDILSGADNFFQAFGAEERPGDARREARRALRGHAHQHQEVDRRLADPGAARRARDPASSSSGSTPTRCRQVVVRVATNEADDRRQPRDPRHLPAAHDGGDAARQDRVVQGGARQARA